MTEIEKVFLARYIPNDIANYPRAEIIDLYIPDNVPHPKLRIRKIDSESEMTKKVKIVEGGTIYFNEQTIKLSDEEFNHLNKLPARRLRKFRYFLGVKDYYTIHFNIYLDDLLGLVLVDLEYPSKEAHVYSIYPDYCLAEVTGRDFIAGGFMCGKNYSNLKKDLDFYKYEKLSIKQDVL